MKVKLVIVITLVVMGVITIKSQAQTWTSLANGISYKEVLPTVKSTKTKTYPVFYLKIERSKVKWHMLAEEIVQKGVDHPEYYTAPDWAEKHDLNVVVNMGMFGGSAPTGYTRIDGEVLNPQVRKGYKGMLAGYKHYDGMFLVNHPGVSERYDYITHLIRMVADGKVVWSKQPKYWSTVCIGMDEDSSFMYFIFSRSGYSVNTLSYEILRAVPSMKNVFYLEGGPEASIYVKIGDFEYKNMGSYETDFQLNDDNDFFWDLPNVIGISAKE